MWLKLWAMRTRLALLLACATGFVLFSNCTRDQGVTSRDTTLAVRGRLEVPKGLAAPVVIQFCDDQGGIVYFTTANPPDGQFEIPNPPGLAPGQYKIVVQDLGRAGVPPEWRQFETTPLKVTVDKTTAENLRIGQ